jgi:hypothetical protein
VTVWYDLPETRRRLPWRRRAGAVCGLAA